MEKILVALEESKKKSFRKPDNAILNTIIKKINEKGLSLREAEKMVGIEKGAILRAIKNNRMLLPMDSYYLELSLDKMR